MASNKDLFQEALKLQHAGNLVEAASLCYKILAKEPGYVDANFLMGVLNLQQGILDTPYFGGGNTSLESFVCGVPVVTWPGEFMRDRLTLALYKQMGIMGCVANNAQSYLNIAFRLANDKTWSDKIKDKIRASADILYEDIEAVHELERFFEWAVDEASK
jgi:predicted O-linked N-acetylglucosamine transferase (SPINDLY family)